MTNVPVYHNTQMTQMCAQWSLHFMTTHTARKIGS